MKQSREKSIDYDREMKLGFTNKEKASDRANRDKRPPVASIGARWRPRLTSGQ